VVVVVVGGGCVVVVVGVESLGITLQQYGVESNVLAVP
jgi:hypothetical protein